MLLSIDMLESWLESALVVEMGSIILEIQSIDVMLGIICTCLVLLIVRPKRHRFSRKSNERRNKRGREIEDTTAFASGQTLTDKPTFERENMAKFMPNQSASCRKAKASDKANLMGMVKNLAQKGELEQMALLFQDIEKRFQTVMDDMDYHCVIVSLARGGDPVAANRWLNRSMDVGFLPRAGAFSSVILSFGKKGEIEQAIGLFEEMKLRGVEANTVTYNAIMDAWARSGNVSTAQKWMKNMLDENIQPNVVSFGIILSACAAAGLVHDLDMWHRLSQNLGFELNMITFNSVVRAFARKDDVENAMAWVGKMVESNVKPDLCCCMEVLAAIFKVGASEFVDVLIGRMRGAGLQPDGVFFSRCIVLGVKGGHKDKAQRWADDCIATNGRLTWAAQQAMVEAELTVPVFEDASANGEGRGAARHVRAPDRRESAEPSAQRRSLNDIQAARRAAIGERFTGTIKDFVPGQFGYITCAATHELFQRDVFLGRFDNPQKLTKGQRVSFTLRVDDPQGLPRAADVSAVRMI